MQTLRQRDSSVIITESNPTSEPIFTTIGPAPWAYRMFASMPTKWHSSSANTCTGHSEYMFFFSILFPGNAAGNELNDRRYVEVLFDILIAG